MAKKRPPRSGLGPRARQDLQTIQDARQMNPTPPPIPEATRYPAPASSPSPIGPISTIAEPEPSDTASTPSAIPKPEGLIGLELGRTGLTQYYGRVVEEFLPELQYERGRRLLREMSDNDPTIGALLAAITMLVRSVEWRTESDRDDDPRAQFIEECRNDMSHTWEDLIAEIIRGELVFGWSYHEIVYKLRHSVDSLYDDRKIGWKKMPLRSQESLWRWDFKEDTQSLRGLFQRPPPDFRERYIPLAKSLLFRNDPFKANPEGRALDAETPIPTPNGWRAIGALAVGDPVFDEHGKIRYVVARQDWERRPCYELSFRDGTRLIADAAHQWVVSGKRQRARHLVPQCLTTAALAREPNERWSVAWAAPVQYPEQLLPIDPYYLGLWLGDGCSASARLATHEQDVAELSTTLMEHGFQVDVAANGPARGHGRTLAVRAPKKWSSAGPARALRLLGLSGNKHVPSAYLRASIPQRHRLLAGLMDSDGTVDAWGRCEFVNTNRALIDGVAELVRSLGCTASVGIRHRPNSTHRRLSWAVRFSPSWSPFLLTRKAARIRSRPQRQHFVAAILPVGLRRTVCIETDAPSHLFLAGHNFAPTHNSALRNAYRPWYFKKHLEQVEAIGIERDATGYPILYAPSRLFEPGGDPAGILPTLQKQLFNVRTDELQGWLLPLQYDPETKQPLYKFELQASPGRRQWDTSTIITRWDVRILITVLVDFIIQGHDQIGSFSMTRAKIDFFNMAMRVWLDNIAAVFNRYAIPRLLELNGMDSQEPPYLEHGDVERRDLQQLGDYLNKIAAAGMPLFPDPKLENVLRDMADLPTLTPEELAVRTHEAEAEKLVQEQMRQAALDAAKLRAAGGAPVQGGPQNAPDAATRDDESPPGRAAAPPKGKVGAA